MKNFNNLALGLGVAVLGFAVYQYMKSSSSAAQAANAVGSNGTTASGGAVWQNLTFPLGTATGGTNNVGQTNVYSSTSYNPDAISAAIAQDSLSAMKAVYNVPMLNQYQFTMPESSS